MMHAQTVDNYIIINQKYFPGDKILFLKERLYAMDEQRFSMLSTIELKDPVVILIISILGIKLANIYKFPDIIIYKKISFLNLLERIEVILAFNNILNSIFFLIMGTYFLKEVLFQISKKKKEHIILALIDIIFLLVGNFLVTNITFYLFLNLLFLWILISLVITYYLHKYILPS